MSKLEKAMGRGLLTLLAFVLGLILAPFVPFFSAYAEWKDGAVFGKGGMLDVNNDTNKEAK